MYDYIYIYIYMIINMHTYKLVSMYDKCSNSHGENVEKTVMKILIFIRKIFVTFWFLYTTIKLFSCMITDSIHLPPIK